MSRPGQRPSTLSAPTLLDALVNRGRKSPTDAVQTAQKNADELLRPYVEQTALKQPA